VGAGAAGEPRSPWGRQLGDKQGDLLQGERAGQVRMPGRRAQVGGEELGWQGHWPAPRREGRGLREVGQAVTVQAALPICEVNDGQAG
jgi:hypothetical protein